MFFEFLGIKLSFTIQKFLAGLLAPKQIKRIGEAETSVIIDRIREMAQANKDAEDIKKGLKTLKDGVIVDVKRNLTPSEQLQNVEFLRASNKRINLSKTLSHAYEETEQRDLERRPETILNQEEVSTDWFTKWRNYAEDISDNDMQQIWGRLLTGEVENPGRFSLRTLNELSQMTSKEAQLLHLVGTFSYEKEYILSANKIWTDLTKYALELGFSKNNFIYIDNLSGSSFTTNQSSLRTNARDIGAKEFKKKIVDDQRCIQMFFAGACLVAQLKEKSELNSIKLSFQMISPIRSRNPIAC